MFAWAQWDQYALLTDAKHWSAVDKLAFADILGEGISSQAFHGRNSSGCIESAKQPSPK